MTVRAADRLLVAGFSWPGSVLRHGELKVAASRIRARSVVASVAVTHGPNTPLKVAAELLGVSERGINLQFGQRSALFAFPPPEMARVMGDLATAATGWGGVGVLVQPLFEALDTNAVGRELLFNLVELHRKHPDLRCSDNYFAEEMRSIVEVNVGRIGRRPAGLVGYFTDGVRAAFEEWSVEPDQSTIMVAEAIGRLVTNPPVW